MNLFYRYLIVIAVMSSNRVTSQVSTHYFGGAHSESLAHTTSVFQGLSGIYGNIAGLSYLNGLAADVSYDRRFNLEELSTVSLSAAYGTKNGTIALIAGKYGFDQYSEGKLGLAYARKLGNGFSVGGMLDLFQYNIEGQSTANRISFEVSLYSEVSDKIHVGVHIFSPGTVTLTDIQRLGSKVALGVKYMVSKKATIYTDIEKISELPVQFKLAVDYQVQEKFGLRIGNNFSQGVFHIGAYLDITNNVRGTMAYSYHQMLGSTPSLSISYGDVFGTYPR